MANLFNFKYSYRVFTFNDKEYNYLVSKSNNETFYSIRDIVHNLLCHKYDINVLRNSYQKMFKNDEVLVVDSVFYLNHNQLLTFINYYNLLDLRYFIESNILTMYGFDSLDTDIDSNDKDNNIGTDLKVVDNKYELFSKLLDELYQEVEEKQNTTKSISIACFNGKDIRTLTVDNKPYFVAKDVAEALGYKKTRNAIDTHCKKAIKKVLPFFEKIEVEGGRPETGLPPVDSKNKVEGDLPPTPQGVIEGGRPDSHPTPVAPAGYRFNSYQEYTIIPESDLYRLIIKSKLESAQMFEEWVMEEVLPSIRKNGYYNVEDTIEKNSTILTTLNLSNREVKALSCVLELEKKIEDTKQKYEQSINDLCEIIDKKDNVIKEYNNLVSSNNVMTIQDFAYMLELPKLGPNKMYKFLTRLDYIKKEYDINHKIQHYVPTSKGSQYFQVVYHTCYNKETREYNVYSRIGIKFSRVEKLAKLIKKYYNDTVDIDKFLL